MLTICKYTVQYIKYIPIAIQPSPPPISRTLHHPKLKFCIHKTVTPHATSPFPGNHLPTFCVYESAHSRHLYYVEVHNIFPFEPGFFHLA